MVSIIQAQFGKYIESVFIFPNRIQTFSSKEFVKFSAWTMNKYLPLNVSINPPTFGTFFIQVDAHFKPFAIVVFEW